MSDFIQQCTDYAGQLFSLAPAPFTVAILIAIAYGVRLMPWIPNRLIPTICMVAGMIIFPLVGLHPKDMAESTYLVRSISTGFVLGLAAWLVHDKFISKIEAKIPWLGKALAKVDNSQNSDKTAKP